LGSAVIVDAALAVLVGSFTGEVVDVNSG